jgi:RNA-binding protein
LSAKQRRYLSSLGHHLEPVVQVGKDGLSEGLILAIGQALHDHELIKVRLGKNVLEDRKDVAKELAKESGASLVKQVGNVVLLYMKHPEKPTIKLPR